MDKIREFAEWLTNLQLAGYTNDQVGEFIQAAGCYAGFDAMVERLRLA